MLFNTGQVEVMCRLGLRPTPEQIEAEPSLFRTKAARAASMGGCLTQQSLVALSIVEPERWQDMRVDTRSTLLGKGDLPARGGWHCDFLTEESYAKITPDPAQDEGVIHYMLVSGPPLSQFSTCRRFEYEPGTFSWSEVDRAFNRALRNYGMHGAVDVQLMTLYRFDAYELHRAVASQADELTWRWFFRASYFPKGTEYANKIRTQVQIYREAT